MLKPEHSLNPYYNGKYSMSTSDTTLMKQCVMS